MKNIFFLSLLLSFSISLSAQTEIGTFIHDGIEREYQVYVPDNWTPNDQWPVVFNLHGITSNATEQYLYTRFDLVADTANFIVCYPEGTPIVGGTGNQWNVNFPFGNNDADDVGFIDQLIDTLHAHYNINLDKVYSTGMSNGGYMSYKLACELTDRFQAIASVTGSMVPSEATACDPSGTIPVMQVHGTADPTVAYNGNNFGISIEDLVTQWVDHNECSMNPDTLMFEDIDPLDFCTVERISYTDCESNRKVFFYKVDGGTHTWPGAVFNLGVTNYDINASIEIWNFFNQYGTDAPVSNKEVIHVSPTVSIAPNPFLNSVLLETTEAPIQQVQVFNTLGQLLVSKTIGDQNKVELPLENLDSGIYTITVHTSNGTFSETLVKQ